MGSRYKWKAVNMLGQRFVEYIETKEARKGLGDCLLYQKKERKFNFTSRYDNLAFDKPDDIELDISVSRYLAYWMLFKTSIIAVIERSRKKKREFSENDWELLIERVFTAHPCSISSPLLIASIRLLQETVVYWKTGQFNDGYLMKIIDDILLELMSDPEDFIVGGYKPPNEINSMVSYLFGDTIFLRGEPADTWVMFDADAQRHTSHITRVAIIEATTLARRSVIDRYLVLLNNLREKSVGLTAKALIAKIDGRLRYTKNGRKSSRVAYSTSSELISDLQKLREDIPDRYIEDVEILLKKVRAFGFLVFTPQPRFDRHMLTELFNAYYVQMGKEKLSNENHVDVLLELLKKPISSRSVDRTNFSENATWTEGVLLALATVSKESKNLPFLIQSLTTSASDILRARYAIDVCGMKSSYLIPLFETKDGYLNFRESWSLYLDYLIESGRVPDDLFVMAGFSDLARELGIVGAANAVITIIIECYRIAKEKGLGDKFAVFIGVGEVYGRGGLRDLVEFLKAFISSRIECKKVIVTNQGDSIGRALGPISSSLDSSSVVNLGSPVDSKLELEFYSFLELWAEKSRELYERDILKGQSYNTFLNQGSLSDLINLIQRRSRPKSRGIGDQISVELMRAISVALTGIGDTNMSPQSYALGKTLLCLLKKKKNVALLKRAAKQLPLAKHILDGARYEYFMADPEGLSAVSSVRLINCHDSDTLEKVAQAVKLFKDDIRDGRRALNKIFGARMSDLAKERKVYTTKLRESLSRMFQISGGQLPGDGVLRTAILSKLTSIYHIYGTSG